MKKRAMIFDLDGTLSDSIQSIKYSADKALATVGYGPFEKEDYYYFVGDGAANLIKRALVASGDEKLEKFEQVFEAYKEIFNENCMYEVKPYDGIVELLQNLKKKGVKLAVLSNKPHLETIKVIYELFGDDLFDIIQGQTDDLPIKPSPQGAMHIMTSFGVEPKEVVYLGDTATDMKTGKGAGAYTVGALWGFRERKELEEAGADNIIASPIEALQFFE